MRYISDVINQHDRVADLLDTVETTADAKDVLGEWSRFIVDHLAPEKGKTLLLRCMANVEIKGFKHPHSYIIQTREDGSVLLTRYDEEKELVEKINTDPSIEETRADTSSSKTILITTGGGVAAAEVYFRTMEKKGFENAKRQVNAGGLVEKIIDQLKEDMVLPNRFQDADGMLKPQQFLHEIHRSDTGDISLGQKYDPKAFFLPFIEEGIVNENTIADMQCFEDSSYGASVIAYYHSEIEQEQPSLEIQDAGERQRHVQQYTHTR